MKFLIIQTAFPGDVILATPVIEKLKRFYPESRIDFLLRKGNESLFENHPLLHDLLIWDKGRKYASLLRLVSTIRKTGYDHVINLQRFAASGLITALSGAKNKTGFSRNPLSFFYSKRIAHTFAPGMHETVRNLALIADLTDTAAVPPRLYPSRQDEEAVQQFKKGPYLCIAPASVWYTKQLPAHKWAGIVKNVLPEAMVYFIGAAEDRSLAEKIIGLSKNTHTLNLCGRLSWLQTAALMKDARMNYVNDSAPLHVASAMNAPVTAFFCSTIPAFGFGPLSDKSVVIQTREKLACRPCGIHGRKACPLGHFKCAETIELAR